MHIYYCLLRCTLALTVAAIAATAAASNVALHGQEEPRFRSGIDLVNVTATVTDRAGRFVSGLSQNDFVVYEDDRPVEVALFSAERVPVSLGFVLDTSGSMAGDKIGNAFQAIDRFLDWLGPDDEVFLYSFGHDVELVHDWTTHRDEVRDRLRHLYPSAVSHVRCDDRSFAPGPNGPQPQESHRAHFRWERHGQPQRYW